MGVQCRQTRIQTLTRGMTNVLEIHIDKTKK